MSGLLSHDRGALAHIVGAESFSAASVPLPRCSVSIVQKISQTELRKDSMLLASSL